MIAYRSAALPEVRAVGGDIAITQQGQIGVMQTWLTERNLGPTSPTTDVLDAGGQRGPNGNLMPGMATRDEIGRLRPARGRDVDIPLCQLTLRHHQGGIHMVDGLLARTDDQRVRDLAGSMRQGQTSEIAVLLEMLDRLGAKPL